MSGGGHPPKRGGDSRQRILEAAAAIAVECGYEGTTITKVTRRCGLPASSVYWFFKDKDDLLAEVIAHWLHVWVTQQPPWSPPAAGTPVGERVREVLTPAYRRVTEASGLLRVGFMLLLERREVEPTARRRFREVRQDMLRRTSNSFETLLEGHPVADRRQLAERLAQLVLVATDGLFLTVRLGVAVDVEGYVALLAEVVEQAVEDARTVEAGVEAEAAD